MRRSHPLGKIKVELQFSPALVIEEDGANRSVTVSVDPALWFANGDGMVLDLSQFDFDQTGQLVEFEVKFGNGFTKIKIDGSLIAKPVTAITDWAGGSYYLQALPPSF